MMHHRVLFALVLSLVAGVAAAENESNSTASMQAISVRALLQPSDGRVPFMIRTTQPRRVLIRNTDGSSQYVCTTPCRLYVAPGPLAVTLAGWGEHEYQWDVPAHGGSVSLLSRAPSGQLDAMPSERAHSSLRASN
jgi:hypothetical protein